jgi:chemotaxis methyl-accepting protein methylase
VSTGTAVRTHPFQTDPVRVDPYEHLRFIDETSGVLRPTPRPARAVDSGPCTPERDIELDPEMKDLFAWLCDRADVRMDHYRRSVFQRRAGACLRAVRCRSYAEALTLARRDPAQADQMLDAMMVGMTSFFRDAAVFHALEKRLSRWADGSADRPGRRSILSVGCSNGAEVYSCAMLLDTLGLLGRVGLTGIDCRPGAIGAARAARYRAESAEGLPASLLGTYFVAGHGCLHVRDDIRAACEWSVRDAFADHGPALHDVVLCRNLAIYLSAPGASRLWAHMASQMPAGGILVVGKAERPSADLFWRIGPCLYERKGSGS